MKGKFSILILICIFLFSCKKEIELDLRTVEPILVVEAEIGEGSTARVKLTATRGFYEPNFFLPVTDATVTLSSSKGETEDLINHGDSLFLSRNIEGQANIIYYLTIIYRNKTYESQSTLFPAVTLDSVVAHSANPKMPPIFVAYWQDPLGKDIDYYRFRVYVNDSIEVKQNFSGSADIYDGEYLSSPFIIAEVNRINEPIYKPHDFIRFDMLTIDRETGHYFSFLDNRDKTNPPTNIKGGALGYFCAYSKSSQYVEVPEWEMQN
ncbi:MAG: DUF4249 domain-containing protein [Prevotellaceae bacterium]|jgi:hypothetical protein|nr:DUF4249 domain-containing protein [Prevotellaceae bacterium]